VSGKPSILVTAIGPSRHFARARNDQVITTPASMPLNPDIIFIDH
jgi:hypothetical protein